MHQAPRDTFEQAAPGWRGRTLGFLAHGDLAAGACLVLVSSRVLDGGAWFPVAVAVSCAAFLAAFVRD